MFHRQEQSGGRQDHKGGRVMKLTRHRILLAGVMGVAAVVVPVSVPFVASQLAGVPPPPPRSHPRTTSPTSRGRVPAALISSTSPADGIGDPTTQVITPSGKCGTPTVTGTPAILGLSGLLYPADTDKDTRPPDNDDYRGSPSPVPVGSFKQHTGVCGFASYWQIENVPFLGEEAPRLHDARSQPRHRRQPDLLRRPDPAPERAVVARRSRPRDTGRVPRRQPGRVGDVHDPGPRSDRPSPRTRTATRRAR